MIIRIKHKTTILALELLAWEELHKMVTSDNDQHEKVIMHQPSWSYASSITQPSWCWNYQPVKSYPRWLNQAPIKTRRDYHPSTLWSYASSITQPSWRWSYKHGKSYTRWLHHTPIKTRKYYHASIFMIICIKHNPTILALELSTWKELHKIVISETDQYMKRLSCINLHDHTDQA